MAELRTAEDLANDPILPPMGGGGGFESDGSSYDKALNILTVTEDDLLELMTRTNPIMARACSISYCMVATFRSSYIAGRNNLNMRLAVSQGGKGREEIVRSLGASGEAFSVPESETGRTYQPAPED